MSPACHCLDTVLDRARILNLLTTEKRSIKYNVFQRQFNKYLLILPPPTYRVIFAVKEFEVTNHTRSLKLTAWGLKLPA